MIDELTDALRWAVGMAEEAIIAREADPDDDEPETTASHRAELNKARALLSRKAAVPVCAHPRTTDEPNGWTVCVECEANIERWASKPASLPDPDHDRGRGLA